MKKLILILAIGLYASQSHANASLTYRKPQTDTAEVNKQVKKLSSKLADLNSQLSETRNQVPVDSMKMESTLAQSHAAQVKSKKRSEQAVDGDMGDVKSAEKQAKKATKQTSEAEDAAKQLEHDRKKIKKLMEQIEKTQKELDKIQANGA
ncbi:hypothetical protein KXD93_09000 [Mucilaginibacter sp. BJC16-A38]|uniref:hypothetical protein n=1 Tax=Mucilaginibacter phenanthrenivorans TaxID=1234842 RepID=UPI002157E5D6|nr:hypothetical protein [Mucilaginibacter phenanthrenivorans]MCR8557777.1 hypothetical protein [Mucilaginibacter phenanthrenivorans]